MFLLLQFPWSDWIPTYNGDLLQYLANWCISFWEYLDTIYIFNTVSALPGSGIPPLLSQYSLRELLVDTSVISVLFNYFTGLDYDDSEYLDNVASYDDSD